MTDTEFFHLQGQSLLFSAAAGLTLFFVSLAIMRHIQNPWFRLCAILPPVVLLPFAAYFLTHNSHIALMTFSGCNGDMVFAVVRQSNSLLAASEDEKGDSDGKQE